MTASLTASDYRALAGFRYELRRFLHFSEKAARAAGLEPQQHQLLLAVKGLGPGKASIRAIAERLQIEHHSAVELIDRSARRGLVRRVPARDDRRLVVIALRPPALRVLRRLTLHHREALRQAAPALVSILRALTRRSSRRTGQPHGDTFARSES